MMRIRLFGLFIAYALLALVRPRKCMELLDAADEGAKASAIRSLKENNHAPDLAQKSVLLSESEMAAFKERKLWSVKDWYEHVGAWQDKHDQVVFGSVMALRALMFQMRQHAVRQAYGCAPECPLPPAGWRCTRRAGHEGPCAAVPR